MVVLGALASTLFISGEPAAEAGQCDRVIRVMTQNMDTGTDYGLILVAADQTQLLEGVAQTFDEVMASDMPRRAALLADVIGEKLPDLVMLEEVTTLSTGPLMQPPATNVVHDQLDLLLGELAIRGLSYEPVAVLQESDFELPSALGFDVRTTDHDVLLARSDLPRSELAISNVQAHHYVNQVTFGTPAIGQLTVPRGYIRADVKTRGKTYVVAGTHLEDFSAQVQVAQAGELLAALAGATTPVVLCGDFNANADPTGPEQYPTVGDIVAAGYVDDWRAAHPDDPGFTWPLFLEDPRRPATADERIDLIFSRGEADVLQVERTGMTPGRWPSDHAGVVATLRIGDGRR
jgi:endonuclease/exonuclease/phosphatase family metal-dependent hydrolase